MNEITYDKVEDEKSSVIKQLYWNIAFGLQDVDGLKPSRYMVELSQEHINGKKTYYQVQEEITSYYKKIVIIILTMMKKRLMKWLQLYMKF